MKKTLIPFCSFVICLLLANVTAAFAQEAEPGDSVTASASFEHMDEKHVATYINGIDKKFDLLDHQISRKSKRYLARLSRHEQRMMNKMSKVDSSAANLFSGVQNHYQELSNRFVRASEKMHSLTSGQYLPKIDSLSSSLSFLKDTKSSLFKTGQITKQLDGTLQRVGAFKDKINQADEIRQYVLQRQLQLKEAFSKYRRLPRSVSKSLGKYSETAYYYGQEISEIKESINDPGKLVQKGMSMLANLPAFQQFMQKNSIIASLFPSSNNNITSTPGLPGLQSRADIQQLVQRQLGSSATNPSQVLQQQIQQAQSELSKLKDKVDKIVNKGGDIDMPNFKPNTQKTKSFWKRLEFGAGMQTQKANYFFPMRTDLSLSAGYRISDNKVVGIALAGNVGWGRGWRQIKFTAEGIGLRSFIEWKIKGNFWLAGGAEMNCLKPIDSLRHLKNYDNWTRSAMIGVSRSYRISKKVKGKMQVLYDALHRRNHPASEPVVFRLGYTF